MVSVVNASGNPDIDGILWGWKWDSTNITFSFPTGTAEYSSYTTINGFQAFNAAQQTAVRTILADVASFTNLTFTETTSAGALLRYAEADSINYSNDSSVIGDPNNRGLHTIGTAESNPPELGYGGAAPGQASYAQGDSWYNHTSYNNPTPGTFAYAAGVMHETGHNLGLKHGQYSQDGHGYTFPGLPADHDSLEYSVMTYRSYAGGPIPGGNTIITPANNFPQTFMQDDIAALQYMYGANYNYNNTGTTYSWSTTTGEEFINGVGQGAPVTNKIFMTVWDGGGSDTYDFSNYTTNLNVDLAPGGWSTVSSAQLADLGNDQVGGPEHYARGNIANALLHDGNTASLIENALGGSGNDTMYGNTADNTLKGGGGADSLYGLDGNDTLVGGNGDDTLKGGGGADHLYGINDNDSLKGGGGADVLDGGAGNDTATYLGSDAAVSVNLATGAASGGDAAGDTLTNIENLAGSVYGDFLVGDGNANILTGNDGDDTLKGGGGADTINGGDGIDTASYFDSAAGVTVGVSGTGSGGEAQGDVLSNIENLIGSAYNDTLMGDGGANTLTGLSGDDTLKGGGGADSLYGGDNNDILKGGGGADALNGGNGVDTALYSDSTAGVTVNLATGAGAGGSAEGDTLSGIENLTGSAYNDILWGDANANSIQGGGGDDWLKGAGGADVLDGGAGADTMNGGTGDDFYYVDNALDSVTEAAGQGNDRVFASVSYTLGAGQEIEKLTTDNNAGVAAINLTGNEFANTIFGNAGANTLDGKGGIDALLGLGGDDFYFVDNALDTVFEGAGQGNDRVFASVSYTLGAGQQIETLTTTNNAGVTPINLTGNEFANTIFGNAGANTLDGKSGADTLLGLGGDDFYFVDNALDSVMEAAGQGNDRVFASVSYTLGAGQEIEKLTTDNNAGVAPINLTGNELADTIFGNAGSNALKGGLGADTLVGLGGIDAFVFNTALGAGNVDTVADFNVTDDDFVLASWVFTGLSAGTLAAGQFHVGSAAADADDHVIYNSATGAVLFDADGLGGAAAIQFATMTAGLGVTNADFLVV